MAKSKIYYSEFETLRGDTVSVEIWKEGGTGSEELVLNGDEPVVIEYTQDTVFDTLKLSTCTVNVITDVPLLELYTGTLSDVELRVYRTANTAGAGAKSGGTATTNGAKSGGSTTTNGAEMVWYGFMSPNVYSMPYDAKNNQLGLEFVDPLNAMDSVKYRSFGDKFFATFEEYMEQALAKVGAEDMTVSGIPTELASVGCMQRNYIDEVFDEDDGAYTWQEVMSSIARYMNMTMLCKGKTLCVYDALESGRTALNMVELGFAGQGEISLGEVYNKVTVVENTNPIDGLLDSEIDDKDNMESFMYEDDPNFDEESSFGAALGFYRTAYKKDDVDYVRCDAMFKPKSEWSFEWYGLRGAMYGVSSKVWGSTTIKQSGVNGCFPYVWYNLNGKATEGTTDAGAFLHWTTSYKADEVPSSLDWDKSVWLVGEVSGEHGEGGVKTSPFIKYESSNQSIVLKDGYLLLKLKYKYKLVGETNHTWSEISGFSRLYYLDTWKIKLKIGDKYWNGKVWTTTESTFTASHTWKGDDSICDNEVAIDNTASYEMSLLNDDEGHVIPIDGDLFGGVEMELIPPTDFGESVTGLDFVDPVLLYILQITELSLQYTVDSSERGILEDKDTDADITICNVIDDNNVQEMEDVEFTTNTWSKSQVSYSYAIKKGSDGSYAYYVPDEPIPEQTCIKRMVEYYKEPKMTYEITLENTSGKYIEVTDNISAAWLGKTFTVGGVTYDLMENTATCKLLEL